MEPFIPVTSFNPAGIGMERTIFHFFPLCAFDSRRGGLVYLVCLVCLVYPVRDRRERRNERE